MSGDYFYEFGKMSKRRFFSRLGTNRVTDSIIVSYVRFIPNNPGHLLDDQILVDTLHRTKVMSEEIQKRLEKASRDESKIQQVSC